MAVKAAVMRQMVKKNQQILNKYPPSYLTIAWKNISCTSGVTLVHDRRVVSGGFSLSSAL